MILNYPRIIIFFTGLLLLVHSFTVKQFHFMQDLKQSIKLRPPTLEGWKKK